MAIFNSYVKLPEGMVSQILMVKHHCTKCSHLILHSPVSDSESGDAQKTLQTLTRRVSIYPKKDRLTMFQDL